MPLINLVFNRMLLHLMHSDTINIFESRITPLTLVVLSFHMFSLVVVLNCMVILCLVITFPASQLINYPFPISPFPFIICNVILFVFVPDIFILFMNFQFPDACLSIDFSLASSWSALFCRSLIIRVFLGI